MTFVHDPRPSFEAARAIVRGLASAPRVEDVMLSEAMGKTTARPVYATSDHPRFDCSAMDGFALPTLSIEGASFPIDLPIGTAIRAGLSLPPNPSGFAIPISTGARVPSGYDAVVAREKATILEATEGDYVRLNEAPISGTNTRRRGEDGRAHDQLLSPGDVLSAEAIGALAAFGVARIPVFARPRLAMLRTGDEVTPTDEHPGAEQIFDVNGPMIAAMAKRAGLRMDVAAKVRDEDGALVAAFASLDQGEADIIMSTGGVSVGNHDRVPDVLRALGATIHFHGVRMRPGKPLLFASFPSGKLVFGLPGNPVAAAAAFRFFVMEAVRSTLRMPLEVGVAVALDLVQRPGTAIIQKARRTSYEGEALAVEILPGQQSHRMRPMLTADYWVIVDTEYGPSTRARAFPMDGALPPAVVIAAGR